MLRSQKGQEEAKATQRNTSLPVVAEDLRIREEVLPLGGSHPQVEALHSV